MELYSLTIEQAREGLKQKKFSGKELWQAYLTRIKKLNPELNAFLRVADEPAAGLPVAVKDNLVVKGQISTAGSKILENYQSPYTATAVRKILEADSGIVGKTNLDEFAMGSSTENSGFGPTKNPWDVKRVPGGSSGGSAAAVAADLCVYALGSDTGGSIRQPASFCGVVGLKPTYGRVSRYGLIAMASSLDQVGPITKTVRDAALVLNTLAGFDEKDATTRQREREDFAKGIDEGIKGLKIGVPREFFSEGVDSGVTALIEEAVKELERQGAKVTEVDLPSLKLALPVYYIIMPVEVASNLERYDGIKYGLSTRDKAGNLLEVYQKSREAGFGSEAKRRILLGTYASSAGYYDAYYKKALQVQQVIRREFQEVFDKVDVLAGPTAPTTAFALGEKADDPLEMYLSDTFTVPVNIAGLPGISVPAGLARGLPVGLQLIAPWWEERTLLRAAYTYEQATEHYKDKPLL